MERWSGILSQNLSHQKCFQQKKLSSSKQTMGFFSDPAARPASVVAVRAMEKDSEEKACIIPKRGSSKRRSTTRKIPKRTKSLDTTVPPGMSYRGLDRRRSLADSSNSNGSSSFSSSRRSLLGDSSRSSMTSHLENIEAFCMVMQGTSGQDRDNLLRDSFRISRQNGRKSSRRSSLV